MLDRTVDQNDSAVITKECFESFQQSPSYSYIIFIATYFMFFFKFEMSIVSANGKYKVIDGHLNELQALRQNHMT